MLGQPFRNPAEPGERSAALRPVEPPRQHGRRVGRVVQAAVEDGVPQDEGRVGAGHREQHQLRPQYRPGRRVRDARDEMLGVGLDLSHAPASDDLLGAEAERVDIAVDGRLQPGGRIGLDSPHAGRRQRRLVARQHGLQHLGWGRGHGRLPPRQAVGLTVADHLDVGVVCQTSAGHHRVELLAALRPGEHAVHGVDRRTLRAVDRGRVTTTGDHP